MTDPDPPPIDFDRCTCTGVTRAEVLAALDQRGCRTVEDVQRATGACTGCRTCRPELELLLRARGLGRPPATPAPRPRGPEGGAPGA
jgi:NAD(P)H-nitrite reductase large subunit